MTHYSTQVETRSPELETIKARNRRNRRASNFCTVGKAQLATSCQALRNLGAFCPPGEGLKSLESEASDKGARICGGDIHDKNLVNPTTKKRLSTNMKSTS